MKTWLQKRAKESAGNLQTVSYTHLDVYKRQIGQCMGNRDIQAAEIYFKKLTKITLLLSSVWNFLIFLLTPLFMRFYALEPDTKQLVIWLVLIHNLFNAIAYPFSGALSNGLRAAGDVKFTMYISLFCTVVCRVALSILFGVWMQGGVIGIAFAMAGDWCIKAVILAIRYKSGKWKKMCIRDSPGPVPDLHPAGLGHRQLHRLAGRL